MTTVITQLRIPLPPGQGQPSVQLSTWCYCVAGGSLTAARNSSMELFSSALGKSIVMVSASRLMAPSLVNTPDKVCSTIDRGRRARNLG